MKQYKFCDIFFIAKILNGINQEKLFTKRVENFFDKLIEFRNAMLSYSLT